MNGTPFAAPPNFRGQVVQKIYRVWLLRKFLPVLVAEIVVFSLLLYYLGRFVFVQRILENALRVFFTNPTEIFVFLTSAFTHATVAAKVLGVGVVVLLALVIRQLTQGVLRFILVKENYFSRTK
ncbi:MAG: hypothetical protein HYW89_01385 [Candidatus Sungiibacteriota bacterium]|uniref:Uncharacterized protein n=1 Tax=Candidatus Sungiibacteriota bacterium TaxID=2750080 RepID=A0A7T5RK21_9BACT|nr:MAG: hypothetical protein HYW89_01385 [Candidatus Sungbacteria bacterium]